MPEFETPQRRPQLLIVSNDVVDVKMAGPGMRYLEMARALLDEVDITLAIPSATSLEIPEIRLVEYQEDRPHSLRTLVENSDITLISGYIAEKHPFLQRSRTLLVVDLYDPFILENLHYYLDEPMGTQERHNRFAVETTNRLAKIGDFFICGSERQRDFWMGVLEANGRINPYTFAQDPSLSSLIDVVGIGFPDRDPQPRPILRGIHPSFPEDSRIVLWGGGIWDWLDPLTLVNAWPQVISRFPTARLVFMGTRHPNPNVPYHEMAKRTETLADEIGEKGSTIIFFEWLNYDDREALLCEADIGVTLHPLHVETRYAIRTRVLDYLWARLPVLITEGDVTSVWVRSYNLGKVVPEADVDVVAQALCEMLAEPKDAWDSTFEPLRDIFAWPRVVAPLKRYCLEGTRAADLQIRNATFPPNALVATRAGILVRVLTVLREEGVRSLLRRTGRYIGGRLGLF